MSPKFFPYHCLLFLLLFAHRTHAQPPQSYHLEANLVAGAPEIDGVLDEGIWQNTISSKSAFIQSAPNNGQASEALTEVIVLYNEVSIYVGAQCWILVAMANA